MRVLDLFSGIGGFSLGLERAGMRTVAFCEIEPYCRAVLRKHWPNVPIFEDVRTLTAADVPGVDVICGGFPCQDISVAGKGAGITGERSGLWSEYARLIGDIRPRYAIVENVAALLGRGLPTICGDLAAIGYDAEWHVISAADVGAPHRRERVWIVAYPRSAGRGARNLCQHGNNGKQTESRRTTESVESSETPIPLAYSTSDGRISRQCEKENILSEIWDAERDIQSGDRGVHRISKNGQGIPDSRQSRLAGQRTFASRIKQEFNDAGNDCRWQPEPNVGRVANGVPARVDRLKGLGNAVVPQIPEIIGRAIMQAEGLT